jgi:hypothetical protein
MRQRIEIGSPCYTGFEVSDFGDAKTFLILD